MLHWWGARFILALIWDLHLQTTALKLRKALGVGPFPTDTSYADGMPIFLLANRGGNADRFDYVSLYHLMRTHPCFPS
jgi:hypothetical protein